MQHNNIFIFSDAESDFLCLMFIRGASNKPGGPKLVGTQHRGPEHDEDQNRRHRHCRASDDV